MDLQQKFAERLLLLLNEKKISQGEFAKAMNCSRQSINFYILGKRSPEITLAAQMADFLDVSCDYLIGFSNFRNDVEGNVSARNIGLTEDTMKFFAGLKMLSEEQNLIKEEKCGGMLYAQETLKLLNALISHDSFGILLQYIKRYRDICHDEDIMLTLKNFMIKVTSPTTGKNYGNDKETTQIMKEFCLHVISKYMDKIIRDITE